MDKGATEEQITIDKDDNVMEICPTPPPLRKRK
jgi:hypothetical protein